MKTSFIKIFALVISLLGISGLSCKLASDIPLVAATPKATATATLSPLQSRAGLWQGTTSFGSFAFEVSPDGTEIVNPVLHYETEGGIITGDITLTDPTRFPIEEDNSFELSVPDTFIFKVQFSLDGTSASGYWEMINPFAASENWEIRDHIGGESQVEPVSEATAAYASEPTQIPLTPIKISPTVEPSVIIGLSKSAMGASIQLEVIKGNYKLVSGAELYEGSNISVQEDWLTFPVGLAIQVEEGGVTLKGKKYPSGSVLVVDEQERLVEVSGGGAGANLPDGLVAYYPFEGNAEDASGNGHDGTVHGATLTADREGTSGNAYLFDGKDDYISVNDSPQFDVGDGDMTIVAWVYPFEGPDFMGIISHTNGTEYNDGWWWTIGGTDTMWVAMNNTEHTFFKPPLSLRGRWIHFAFVKGGSAISFYIDGELQDEPVDLNLSVNDSSGDLRIGMEGSKYGAVHFSGKIDDVRFYNRALTPDEILKIFADQD